MTAHSLSDYVLPYQPVPPTILASIRSGLLDREFEESAIRTDHVFTGRGAGLKVHQAAFTDRRRWDPVTSGVNFYYNAAQLKHDQILDALTLSGAPFNLIGGHDSASLYILSRRDRIQIQAIEKDVPYAQISTVFAKHGADITPQRIWRAKQGMASFVSFPDFNPLQLRLFAVTATGDMLVEQFKAAVHTLRKALQHAGSTLDPKAIAIQLLAAVVLAHKEVLGEQCAAPDAPLDLVVGEAYRRFDRYFAPSAIERCSAAAEEAYRVLQQARYSSFTPDILEALYVAACPESELRKWEGRYNTPLYLTQHILDSIPIEVLPPGERIVADMTCGVGNFLQAAHDRLSRLSDMQDSGRSLRNHIFGNDRDEFTAQLAGLSLLLTSLTDRWRIDHEDALEWKWLSRNRPTIIVGNPPFFGSRKSGTEGTEWDAETGKSKRYQKADDFLERAITRLAPGGFLAMVMPQSFCVAQASPSTRKYLLEECDIQEIWELPSEIFPRATVRPMVLFAQRKIGKEAGKICPMPVRVRTVQRKALESFQQEQTFTASSLVASQESWGESSRSGPYSRNTHQMQYQIILESEVWSQIREQTHQLREIADITVGAIVGSQRRWRWSDYPRPRRVRWLSGARQCMPRPFYLVYEGDVRLYPNEFEEPRKNRRFPHLDKEHLLASKKVLLVSDPDPTWGQRVKVAIDRDRYYPSDSFWVLVPNSAQPRHISLEVLAAVVSWYVSNGWVVEHLTAPKIPSAALRSIPFPRELSADDCRKLEAAVRRLEKAAQKNQNAPDAQRVIDEVLQSAYQLDEAVLERLRMVAQWDRIDPGTLRTPRPNPAKLVSVTGGVEEVEARSGMITLWLNGFVGLSRTRITDEMPGWLLRPGAAFRAKLSEENYRQQSLDGAFWIDIVPQEYTYLSEDELLDQLDARFTDLAVEAGI